MEKKITLNFTSLKRVNFNTFTINIIIENPFNLPIVNYYLQLHSDPVFYAVPVSVKGKNQIELTINAFKGKTVLDFESLRFSLVDINSRLCSQVLQCGINLGCFLGNLFQPNDLTYNILLFGAPGSGKSSFINSMYTTTSLGNDLRKVAIAGGTTGCCTKEIQYYRICDLDNLTASPYRLIDVWGVTENNFEVFPELLQGRIKDGFRMGKELKSEELTELGFDRKPHCIMFFITAAELEENSDSVALIQQYIVKATNLKVSSMIVISKIDEFSETVNIHRNQIRMHHCQRLLHMASSYFNLPEHQIVPLLNYKLESQKSLEVDKWVYRAFKVAVDNAHSRQLSTAQNQLLFS